MALPWAEWGSQFRESMPGEIQELMDEIAAGSTSSDHTKAIRDRLKSIMDLFRVSRYRPNSAGVLEIDAELTAPGVS